MDETLSPLLSPTKLWSRPEILQRPCPVPDRPGVYAWYFKQIPPFVPTEGCITCQGLILLYAGISPTEPSNTGKVSRQNLYMRIRAHYRGNAYGSTLRRSLGCLLRDQLGLTPVISKNGKKIIFGKGEEIISDWMSKNAFVTWLINDTPWEVEKELIRSICLPLNLQGNDTHPFHQSLKAIRKICKEEAQQ